jgi:hypothetical protein
VSNLDTAGDGHPRRYHHEPVVGTDDAACPYCGQPITRKEFDEIRARIEAEERQRIAGIEQTLKDRFAKEKAHAETAAKAAIEKARREAAKAADQRVKAAMANQEAVIAQRLQAQKQVLDKATAEAVAAEKVKAFEEKTRLNQQLAEMQRRLEARTAHQIGEPAEVDLFEALKAAFPNDNISRVSKGRRGPDVVVEVVHGGAVVGSIVLDSKNHQRWSSSFTRKLRSDQLAAGADFGILSSASFPAAAEQHHLYLSDGVIVARPALVSVLVSLLRQQVIESYRLRLTGHNRNEKADALLAYLSSKQAGDVLDQIVKLTDDAVALDQSEKESHQKVWRRRSDLIAGIRAAHDSFFGEVGRIIGGEQ